MTTPKGQSPDYGFRQGLNVRVLNYTDGQEQPFHSDYESLRALPGSGADKERDAQVESQLLNPYVERIGATAVEFCVIGPEDAPDVSYALYGWGGNTRHPVAVNEAKSLAARFPDRQFIFANVPGAGRSDLLSKSLSKAIRQGDYSGYGELVVDATKNVVDGKNVHMRGHSLGARTAIAATPYVESGVESLIVNDPTGSRKMSLGQIAWRYGVKESGHLGQYVEHAFDPEAARLQKAPISAAMRDTQGAVKGSMRHQLLVDPIGLSRETLAESLYVAAPNVQENLRVIVPELSELNDWREIDKIVAAARGFTDSNTTVETWILKGHTHSWMTSAPTVEALLYDETIGPNK